MYSFRRRLLGVLSRLYGCLVGCAVGTLAWIFLLGIIYGICNLTFGLSLRYLGIVARLLALFGFDDDLRDDYSTGYRRTAGGYAATNRWDDVDWPGC